jgi:hypothetical protein
MQANNKKGGNKLPKSIQIGHMTIPEDYFEMDSLNKETVCVVLMNEILELIDKQIPKHLNRFDFLEKVIDSSIQTNIEEEHYEVCAVLKDIKQLING